jgi:mRNA-degrading endonuclease RelE of RelBE toxin-antitoxin system
MLNNSHSINIDLTPEYRRNLKDLAKKYRSIRSDTQSVIEDLQKGIIVGDRLTGFGSEIYVYKLRVKNSNIQKGKSAGYRLIYLLESALGEYFGEEQKGWLLFQLIHRLRSLGSFTPLKKLLYRHILKKVQF